MTDYAELNQCLYDGKAKEVDRLVREFLAAGRPVDEVLNEGLIGVMAIMGVTALGAQQSRVVLTDDTLRIRGDLYGRSIPIELLNVDSARVVDLRGEPSLQPVSRRMGTGMPGYSAGWFRLRNGARALVYLTARDRVAYVPFADGYVLLLSLRDPDAMIRDLRRRAS
jgi:hypothetical protein